MASAILNDYTSNDLVVVSWEETLEGAYAKMRENNVRHLPVAGSSNEIVGIISDRDFQRAMESDPSDRIGGKSGLVRFKSGDRVRDFMSWPIEVIEKGASIGEAARKMVDQKISALIVVQDKQITGIVTSEDLLRVLAERAEAETKREEVGTLERLEGGLQETIYNSQIGDIAHRLANIGI